ncbi:MAG: dephospho-CoA kinase, partial [Myxococcales bacterium]|nr:dephospho-CoA kinase [Myxococcales bacterium]
GSWWSIYPAPAVCATRLRMNPQAEGPRLVGLTGGLASGKSTVASLLRALGAEVVDADEVAREVAQPGRPAYRQIVATFGPEVVAADGTLDRARLAERVFSDEASRRQLHAIMHPEIAAESARRIQALFGRGVPVVIYEATLIVENGLHHGLAGLIVVDLPPEEQLRRAVQRGLSESQARLRMMAQADRETRRQAATWIIDNSGDREALRPQVEAVWKQIRTGTPPGRSP